MTINWRSWSLNSIDVRAVALAYLLSAAEPLTKTPTDLTARVLAFWIAVARASIASSPVLPSVVARAVSS